MADSVLEPFPGNILRMTLIVVKLSGLVKRIISTVAWREGFGRHARQA
jgi:hypothetical protein